MADIVGVGSPFVDYFFESDSVFLKKYDLKPEDDFLFEEKNIKPEQIIAELPILAKSPGGISVNTIATLARLGIKSAFYGVIGKDMDGDFWLNNIGEIDKSKIIRRGKMSYCDCILTHKRKNRTFLSKMNTHDNDFIESLDYQFLNKPRILHIGPIIENPQKGITLTYRLLQKITRPVISFTPGIHYIAEGKDYLLPILNRAKILFVNRKEMNYLISHDPKKGSTKLLDYGPEIVVCTLGALGAYITTKNNQYFIPRVDAEKVIDTTGAGDAFAAGFLYGILKNKSLKWSAEFASQLAAKSLTDFGLLWLKGL